jgi:hypothetical protein
MLENRIQYGYMYHHLVTLLFLFSNYSSGLIHLLLLNAELSNLPGYIVYHKLKIKKNCNFEKVIQLLFFFYFRLYKFSTFVFKYYENNFIMNNLLVIYFLGQLWFVKQAREIMCLSQIKN